MFENIQTFIQMGLMQIQADFECAPKYRVNLTNLASNRKLLLLDMDETLLHAATLQDIYIQKLYGDDAHPSFITSFKDSNTVIEIGVFLRPYLMEMLRRL